MGQVLLGVDWILPTRTCPASTRTVSVMAPSAWIPSTRTPLILLFSKLTRFFLAGAGISHAGYACSSRARARARSIGKIKRFLIVTIFVGRRIHGSRPRFGQSSDPASDCRSVSSSRQAGDRISRAAGTASSARSRGAEQPVSGFHRRRASGPELLGAQPHADPPRQEAVVPGLGYRSPITYEADMQAAMTKTQTAS
jgi:hypothetical protein